MAFSTARVSHPVPLCSRWCIRQGVPFAPQATGPPAAPEPEASRWPVLLATSRPPGGQGLLDRTGSGPLRATRGRTAGRE
jgi:hypothetical protein